MANNKKNRRLKKSFENYELKKEREEAERASQNIQEIDTAYQSLYDAVNFVVNGFFRTLMDSVCGHCKLKVVDVLKTTEDCNTPEQPLCGHWMHRRCIEEVLTKPPFGEKCPVEGCTQRVVHRKWTPNTQIYEKTWSLQQALDREMQDVKAMFQ
eukprot:GHVO01022648.1.p1 GENE.GHVO01022648.1~~GHVO01022648.1.p1  ORF type:complete len:178 (+),score=31.05 GHVO01022648.1:73-534(+)